MSPDEEVSLGRNRKRCDTYDINYTGMDTTCLYNQLLAVYLG